MEALAWGFYVAFLVGPYVLAVLFVLGFLVLVSKVSFRIHKQLGYVSIIAITLGVGWILYKYAWLPAVTFNSACKSGTGLKVAKRVSANSYALLGPAYGGGLNSHSDASYKEAVLNVAFEKMAFVELQDWVDGPEYRHHSPFARLAMFRRKLSELGFYKIYLGKLGADQCGWLIPNDVKPMDYEDYLSYGLDHKVNEPLLKKDENKKCIAVEYISKPTSPYSIEFTLDERIGNRVVKHAIRVFSLNEKKSLIGEAVAFEFKAQGVFSSVGFWLINGQRHPRCPLNLLDGRVIGELLM